MNTEAKLRSILVGVDGSVNGHGAIELSIQLAKRFGSRLIGIDVVDEQDLFFPGYGGAEAAKEYREEELLSARERAKQSLAAFEYRCRESGVSAICCSETGNAADRIVREAQRSDLIVLGRETHFYSEWLPDSTVGFVLRNAARPVVTVPLSLPQEQNVLVAYDGSRPAAKTLFASVALGLGENQRADIVNVAQNPESAASVAQPAFDFLEQHDVDSQLHTISLADDVHKVVLNVAAELDGGLLVAGAFGQSRLHEFVLGSTTRKLIHESHIPVFMFH